MENSLICFAHSVQGAKHIQSGKPCQDWSHCEVGEDYRFIAVADGHGSDQYFRSDVGSRLAVEAARECMTNADLIEKLRTGGTEKARNSQIQWLEKSILSKWNGAISKHRKENPFTEDELGAVPEKYAEKYRKGEKVESAYGTTLIAALWTDAFLLAVQIGDGSCVTLGADGAFDMPVPGDEKCSLGTTTSLCDPDAINEFRHKYIKEKPAAVILASDGIDDSFGLNGPEASPDQLYSFYQKVMGDFKEKHEADAVQDAIADLKEGLPLISERRSRDDISVGVIADPALLPVPVAEPEAEAVVEPAAEPAAVPVVAQEAASEPMEDPKTITEKGRRCYNARDFAEAAKLFRQAADKGHAVAQYYLGLMHEDGNGFPADYSEAVKWYHKAAEQNHAEAQYHLGQCYRAGLGVTHSEEKGIQWLQRAAAQGHEGAKNFLRSPKKS